MNPIYFFVHFFFYLHKLLFYCYSMKREVEKIFLYHRLGKKSSKKYQKRRYKFTTRCSIFKQDISQSFPPLSERELKTIYTPAV